MTKHNPITPLANTHPLYSKSYRWLHWTIAIGFCLLLIAGQQFNFDLTPQYRQSGLRLHSSLGVIIICAAMAMAIKRFIVKSPRPTTNLPLGKKMIAAAVQLSLYILALFIPVTGVLTALYSPLPTHVFGVVNISLWPLQEAEFAHFRRFHELGTFITLGLLTAHAGAALFHHFIVKDGVLRSMIVIPDKTPNKLKMILMRLNLI